MAGDRRTTDRPARTCATLLAVWFSVAVAITPQTGAPAPIADHASELCEQAIASAATTSGVPDAWLRAIAVVESGRNGRPWPWAINKRGQGTWHADRAGLEAHIRQLQTKGEGSFDIGCFQINTRWHGAAFGSLEAMADPQANADYAAAFLTRLKAEFGSWEAAAGAYHSRTPDLAEAYRQRVLARLAAPDAPVPTPAPPSSMSEAAPAAPVVAGAPTRSPAPVYPLLLAGAPGGPGSLVPAQPARAPFLPGWVPR